jgi:hypothetical protein
MNRQINVLNEFFGGNAAWETCTVPRRYKEFPKVILVFECDLDYHLSTLKMRTDFFAENGCSLYAATIIDY